MVLLTITKFLFLPRVSNEGRGLGSCVLHELCLNIKSVESSRDSPSVEGRLGIVWSVYFKVSLFTIQDTILSLTKYDPEGLKGVVSRSQIHLRVTS